MTISPLLLALSLTGAACLAAVAVWLVLSRQVTVLSERVRGLEGDLTQAKLEADARVREESARLRAEGVAEVARYQEEMSALEANAARRAQEQDAAEAQTESLRRDLESQRRRLDGELAQLSGLTPDDAKALAILNAETIASDVATRRAKEIEQSIEHDAERRAMHALLSVIERNNVQYTTEATVAVVNLPSDEIKGRIIGREGRNIRAFEQVTGVDLIIDETPETVVISSFDPVRREAARLALMNLMIDGRIHPGRIEELHENALTEVHRSLREAALKAADEAGVAGLPNAVIEQMGPLRFRTSYAQNVLDHSVEVAHLAAMLASELGFNADVARVAGFLHDIGKGLGVEWEGPHALTGMEFLRQHGLPEPVLNAVGAHHREIEPASPEARLVIIADSISAARPGGRRENLDQFVKRLAALEQLANAMPGVERSYAMQGGREIRLIVRPEQVDDLGANRLARELARKIESELQYPGQIKVTVIRETRAQEIAK
jgi:ribonuclease Y